MLCDFGRDLSPFGQTEQLFIFQMRLGGTKVRVQACDSIPNPRLALHCRSTVGTVGKMIVDLQQPNGLQMPIEESSKLRIGDVVHYSLNLSVAGF
jgi:hypothetical protein